MGIKDRESRIKTNSFIMGAMAVSGLIAVMQLPVIGQLSAPDGPGPKMDPTFFRIPVPPIEAAYHHTATIVLTWVMFALGAAATLFALMQSIRTKNVIPVVIAISAVGLCIPEIFVELMGACYYPTSPDNIAFTILGRQMSWFILAGWFGFGAPFLVACYTMFKQGASARLLWIAFALSALSSVPIEEVLLHYGVYYYYGNQPLVLFAKHPFWWAPCNAGGLFLAAALAYRFEHLLQGWRSLALLMIVPMAMGAFYGFIALPSWIVVNGNYSWLITQAAGVLTLLMGVAGIALIIELVVKPRATLQSSQGTRAA